MSSYRSVIRLYNKLVVVVVVSRCFIITAGSVWQAFKGGKGTPLPSSANRCHSFIHSFSLPPSSSSLCHSSLCHFSLLHAKIPFPPLARRAVTAFLVSGQISSLFTHTLLTHAKLRTTPQKTWRTEGGGEGGGSSSRLPFSFSSCLTVCLLRRNREGFEWLGRFFCRQESIMPRSVARSDDREGGGSSL